MSQVSISSIASSCLGATEDPLSVVEDFFELKRGYTLKTVQLSVARHIELITGSGESQDLNVQVMGYDGLTTAELNNLEAGMQVARDIFEEIDVGIRHLNWIEHTEAQAGGYTDLADADEYCLKDSTKGGGTDINTNPEK